MAKVERRHRDAAIAALWPDLKRAEGTTPEHLDVARRIAQALADAEARATADPVNVLGYSAAGIEVCEQQEGWLVITGKEGESFNPAALFFDKARAEQYCELQTDDGDGGTEHVAFDACAVEAVLFRNRIIAANDYTIEGCAALRKHVESAMAELEAKGT